MIKIIMLFLLLDFLSTNKLPFNSELLKLGSIFKKNKDKNGYSLCNIENGVFFVISNKHLIKLNDFICFIYCKVHFIVKTHKKGRFPHDEVCKFIAYFFETEYTFSLDKPLVLLFDMTDSGYSNTVSSK